MYMTCFLSIKLSLSIYPSLPLLLWCFPPAGVFSCIGPSSQNFSQLHSDILNPFPPDYSTPIFLLFYVGVLLLRIEDGGKELIVGFFGFLEMEFCDDQRTV